VLPRLVLGYIVALPAIVGLVANCIDPRYAFTLVVKMSAVASGPIQVFYDTGAGFSEAQSVMTPLRASGSPGEYAFPILAGSYRNLRIDPGTSAGIYVIEHVGIRSCGGWLARSAIPLADLVPSSQLEAIRRSHDRLVLEAPPGSNDPQLLYVPAEPLSLLPYSYKSPWLVGRLLALWAVGTLLVCGAERILRPIAPMLWRLRNAFLAAARTSPRTGLVAVALLSTIIATYPVVALGRSFVSPNYGTPLLYDGPPYTPGGADFTTEDVRGTDVGASMWQSVPHAHIQRQALGNGEIPLWNRYNAAGRPLWGQGLTFFLDPLHWFTLVGPDPAIGWDLKLVAHRFVFAAGVGLAAFVATGAWLPSALVAAGAPFAGAYSYRFNHPAIFSLTYAPWVLLSWFLLARVVDHRQGVRALSLLAVTSSLVLISSTPKEGAIALLGLQTTGVLAVLLARDSLRKRMTRMVMSVLAGVAFILLTMPHWFIFLQTLRSSVTGYDNPHFLFAEFSHAVGLFVGPLTPGILPPAVHLLALVFTIAAISEPRQVIRHSPILACAIGAAALIAVAFGAVPVSWLLRIPLLRNVGHLFDACLTAAVTLILVFSAAGAKVLLAAGARRSWLVTVLTSATCLWLVSRFSSMAPPNSFEPWAMLLISPVAIALPACLLCARRGLVAVAASGAAVAVLLFPGGLHVDSGIELLDRMFIQPRPRAALDANSPAVDSVHRVATEPARAVGVDHVLFPSSQALYELEGLGGADPLEVPEYRELVDTAGIARDWYWLTLVTTQNLERLTPLLDMLNVGFLVARADALPLRFDALTMSGGDMVRAAQRTTAWPRAFFVDGVTTFSDLADLLGKVKQHGRPFAAIETHDSQAVHATRQLIAPSGLVMPAKDYALTVNSTQFKIRAPTSGIAVLGETFLANDFRATLNGRAVDYFRVNHVFKAVVIPAAGDWEVRFVYRPKHWTEVWLAALGGVLLLAVVGLATEIRYRRRIRLRPSADRQSPTAALQD
jgi:hypothetical protein